MCCAALVPLAPAPTTTTWNFAPSSTESGWRILSSFIEELPAAHAPGYNGRGGESNVHPATRGVPRDHAGGNDQRCGGALGRVAAGGEPPRRTSRKGAEAHPLRPQQGPADADGRGADPA